MLILFQLILDALLNLQSQLAGVLIFRNWIIAIDVRKYFTYESLTNDHLFYLRKFSNEMKGIMAILLFIFQR